MKTASARIAAPAPAAWRGRALEVGPAVRRAPLERWFVWGTWLALLAFVLVCIARYGRNIPLAEDWTLVPAYTGHEPHLFHWLWSQNNEHRVPLPRLLLLGLLHLTGGDFRAGMVASTLLLAGVAAALMRTAEALRGAVRWTDAVFPLLLLHIGHWENLVWGWQLQFTFSATLTLLLLAAVLLTPAVRGAFWPAIAAVALVALPLCGANGLVVVLGMAPWAVYAGATGPQDGSVVRVGRFALPRRLLWLGGAAAVGVALVGLYFVGYERPSWVPPNPGALKSLTAAAKIAAMAFGPGVAAHWGAFVVVTGLFLAAAAVCLVRGLIAAWRGGDVGARSVALGLACFGATAAVLTLAMGWGRAGYVPTVGLPDRYAVLAVPSLCLACFVWELYAPRTWGRLLQAGVLAVAVAALPANVAKGFSWRDWYLAGTSAVERDLATGVSRDEIVRRRREFLLHWDGELLSDGMAYLREAGTGPFRRVRDAPGNKAGTAKVVTPRA
jgi:hypothetical protein